MLTEHCSDWLRHAAERIIWAQFSNSLSEQTNGFQTNPGREHFPERSDLEAID